MLDLSHPKLDDTPPPVLQASQLNQADVDKDGYKDGMEGGKERGYLHVEQLGRCSQAEKMGNLTLRPSQAEGLLADYAAHVNGVHFDVCADFSEAVFEDLDSSFALVHSGNGGG